MVATAIYSVTMVLWKETAFPLCRAIIINRFCRGSAPDPAGAAYDARSHKPPSRLGKGIPPFPTPRRLGCLDPRRLELHAFCVLGSTLAMCPLKLFLAAPLFARLWRRRCPHSFIPGLKPYFSANPSHRSLHFFIKTDHINSPDCLLYF